MNLRKSVAFLAILILLLAQLSLGAASAPPVPEQDAVAKIEPLVLEEITASGQTDFFIWMTEKADLSPAYELATKEERGQFVFTALTQVAERTQADLRAFLDRQGVEYRPFYIANKILVRNGNQDLLLTVAARPDVGRITANHSYQLEEPFTDPSPPTRTTAVEPNISFINADDVWALGITGAGTVMAGNDTGLDETHPTILPHYRGCLDPPTCTIIDHNYNWWDATGTYPTDPYDGHGHGTHTTGTMVGDDDGTNQIGVAPGAQTVHCKNMTDGGSGDDATFTECFEWDLAPWDLSGSNPDPSMAPDAINNSWRYYGGGQPQFKDEIQALHAAGILVEVSAGNEGPSCSTLGSPSDYYEVLTTGSINHVDPYPGTITDFSSRGPSSLDPGYFIPDIMAPGENIRSALPGNTYDYWSGTSMAGPHATAIVGLCWSANPSLRGQVEQTIQFIQDTAVPLTGQGGSNCGGDYTEGPNYDWGHGTIDALALVQVCIAMGGAGNLDGTVDDLSTGLPIEDALVEAEMGGGFRWTDLTDPSGYYTMTVAAGTYTVTASAFGYLPETVYNVVVITDAVTTQDLSLTAAPEYVISGTVTEAGTGTPLLARIDVLGTPISPAWTDPGTGFYSVTVPSGTYTFRVSADLHMPEERVIVADQDQTQNFALETLPCILVVDDDGDNPDVRTYYTDGLDDLSLDYNVWDVTSQGDPDAADITGYQMIFWFTGYPWGNTFNSSNETAVSAYLDAGGNFFLSSQDYLYDFGLTPFGQNYLHIGAYDSDVGQTTVTGDTIYDGLGPYSLNYPFTNYSDLVDPDAEGMVAFTGNYGNAGVAYDGGSFHTVFFGYPFEAIPNLPDRVDVLAATVDFFGGCECTPVDGADFTWDPPSPYPGEPVLFSGSVLTGSSPISFTWDLGDGSLATGEVVTHTYTADGTFTVVMTATNCEDAFAVATHDVTVQPSTLPTAGFSHNAPVCLGDPVIFTNTSDPGDPPADTYIWDLGNGISMTVPTTETISHTYAEAGSYTVTLQACNLGGCDVTQDSVDTLPLPVPAFSFTVDQLVVTFTNTSSGASSYLWEFGDGVTSTLEHPVHTYTADGTYDVTLTAMSDSCEDSLTLSVTVGLAPTAGFTFTIDELTVTFTNTTTGGLDYLWEFGDGFTSTLDHPVHTYTVAGTYTVTLIASNDFGTDVAMAEVEILPSGYFLYLPIINRDYP